MSLARPDRPTAPCWGVVVRPQWNKRPRDTRAGAARVCGRDVDSKTPAGDAMGVVREVGVGTG